MMSFLKLLKASAIPSGVLYVTDTKGQLYLVNKQVKVVGLVNV